MYNLLPIHFNKLHITTLIDIIGCTICFFKHFNFTLLPIELIILMLTLPILNV